MSAMTLEFTIHYGEIKTILAYVIRDTPILDLQSTMVRLRRIPASSVIRARRDLQSTMVRLRLAYGFVVTRMSQIYNPLW